MIVLPVVIFILVFIRFIKTNRWSRISWMVRFVSYLDVSTWITLNINCVNKASSVSEKQILIFDIYTIISNNNVHNLNITNDLESCTFLAFTTHPVTIAVCCQREYLIGLFLQHTVWHVLAEKAKVSGCVGRNRVTASRPAPLPEEAKWKSVVIIIYISAFPALLNCLV